MPDHKNKIYYIHSNIKLIENYIKIIKDILKEEYHKELEILNNEEEEFENKLTTILNGKNIVIIDCIHYIVNRMYENEKIKENLDRIIIFNLEHLTKKKMKEEVGQIDENSPTHIVYFRHPTLAKMRGIEVNANDENDAHKKAYKKLKELEPFHYKNMKDYDVEKLSEEVDLEENAPVAPTLVKHRIGVTVSDPDRRT